MDLTWFLLVLASMAFTSIGNIIDRASLSTLFKNPFAFGVIASFVTMLCSLALLAVFPFQGTAQDALLVYASSLALGASSLLWWKALSQGEVTRLGPLHNVFPLFTTAFAITLLGEKVTALQGVGVVIAVVGAVIISVKDFRLGKIEKGTVTMLGASALWGLFEVLQKNALGRVSFWNFWGIAGIAVFTVASFTLASKNVRDEVAAALARPRKALVPAGNELIYFSSLVTLAAAFSLAPATVVTAAETVKLAFLFVFVAIASHFFPKRFKEDLTPRVLAVKIAAAALIAVGIWLAAF